MAAGMPVEIWQQLLAVSSESTRRNCVNLVIIFFPKPGEGYSIKISTHAVSGYDHKQQD
jgi:hypothetical protein